MNETYIYSVFFSTANIVLYLGIGVVSRGSSTSAVMSIGPVFSFASSFFVSSTGEGGLSFSTFAEELMFAALALASIRAAT